MELEAHISYTSNIFFLEQNKTGTLRSQFIPLAASATFNI